MYIYTLCFLTLSNRSKYSLRGDTSTSFDNVLSNEFLVKQMANRWR